MSILLRKPSWNEKKDISVGVDMPKFCGENFHEWLSNRKIREGFLPRKFPLYGIPEA